ncbi:MAG: hypothetical protein HGA76_04735 [Candidatus Firestonebacteria bacterium]|nr:hypothetical protein [Candidatus Firestonebacteria bacterium]
MKCINKYSSDFHVRWLANENSYADGRVFPKDLIWNQDREDAQRVLRQADIIHIQNEVNPEWMPFIKNKRILVQYHSCPVRQDVVTELTRWSRHQYTLMQPMQLRQYGLRGLPNLLDPDEYTPQPALRPQPRIAFAPTNAWKAGEVGSKASREVAEILGGFQDRAEVDVFGHLPYTENLDRKRNADILIDDVVNDTFHKTTLEGCCYGLAVLTSAPPGGWLQTNLEHLALYLRMLLREPEYLRDMQARSREWIMRSWHPRDMVQYYVEAYEKLLKGKSKPAASKNTTGTGLLESPESPASHGLGRLLPFLPGWRKFKYRQLAHLLKNWPTDQPALPMDYWIDEWVELETGFKISGWAFMLGEAMQAAQIHVFLKSEDGLYRIVETTTLARPDVGRKFNAPHLANSGFAAFIESHKFKAGICEVGILITANRKHAKIILDKKILG